MALLISEISEGMQGVPQMTAKEYIINSSSSMLALDQLTMANRS